jgi:hypothetical protein
MHIEQADALDIGSSVESQMPTDRILVENCAVTSANQINGVVPPTEVPFMGTHSVSLDRGKRK